MQPGASREGAGAERTVTGDEVEAVKIDVLKIEARANPVIEQGQLDAQVARARWFERMES